MTEVANPLGLPALLIVAVVIVVGTLAVLWAESSDSQNGDGEPS